MQILLWCGTFVVVFLTAYCAWRARREYKGLGHLTFTTALAVWGAYSLHFVLTLYAAWSSTWALLIPPATAIAGGFVLMIVGALFFVAGIREFRTLRRMSGMVTDQLVTSGIYRWSRNPQNVGWGLFLLGVAVLGRSGMGLLLVGLSWLSFRLYMPDEERHLRQVYGDEYRKYFEHAPRYFGLPKRRHT